MSCCPLHHAIVTLHDHSHLMSTLTAPLHDNNIFHLLWKISQKSDTATPIPSIKYLLQAMTMLTTHIQMMREDNIFSLFTLVGGYPISGLDGDTPSQVQVGGTPSQIWMGGYPLCPRLDGVLPIQTWNRDGAPPIQDWMGYLTV